MKKTFALFLLALVAGGLWAQESSDDLFANPEPDSAADPSQKVRVDTFSRQSIRFFEALDVNAYYVAGYTSDDEFIQTPVNALNFGFGSDARLDKSTRGYASFNISYPKSTGGSEFLYNPYEPPLAVTAPTDLVFSAVEVKELFFDYSLGDLAIIRAGRQTATWGQGRLFNPANLVSGIGGGMALKVATALGPLAVSGVVIKNDAYYYDKVKEKPDDIMAFSTLGAAAQTEYSSPWFTTGVAGFHQDAVGTKGSAYLKTSFLGADLFAEGLGEWAEEKRQSYSALFGLYRDLGDQGRWLKLQAEFLVSGRGNDGTFREVNDKQIGWRDQTLGLAGTSDLLKFVDLKPSVLWLHSLTDRSGQIVCGLVNSSLPHIELTAAMARIYGTPGTRYIARNPDPKDRTMFLTLKLTAQFEIKN